MDNADKNDSETLDQDGGSEASDRLIDTSGRKGFAADIMEDDTAVILNSAHALSEGESVQFNGQECRSQEVRMGEVKQPLVPCRIKEVAFVGI